MKCRICNSEIEAFMSFGDMPIANGFLEADQFDDEYFFELAPAFCETCSTLQIVEQPEPERMFHGEYAFFTRTSKYMVEHFSNCIQIFGSSCQTISSEEEFLMSIPDIPPIVKPAIVFKPSRIISRRFD